MRWGSLREEPPTLALTAPQGYVPPFPLDECQECAHRCASHPRDHSPGFTISRMRPGWHANQMVPAFRCWRAIWLTTVASRLVSSLLISFSVSIRSLPLVQTWWAPIFACGGAWGAFRLFWLEIKGRRDLEMRNKEVSHTWPDQIFVQLV